MLVHSGLGMLRSGQIRMAGLSLLVVAAFALVYAGALGSPGAVSVAGAVSGVVFGTVSEVEAGTVAAAPCSVLGVVLE